MTCKPTERPCPTSEPAKHSSRHSLCDRLMQALQQARDLGHPLAELSHPAPEILALGTDPLAPSPPVVPGSFSLRHRTPLHGHA